MDKLTLEHLAPYLPYGLKVKLSDEGVFNLDSEYPNEHQGKTGIITHFTCADDSIYGEFKVSDRYYFSFNELTEIVLCLRPLSHLTKEIEHNGERFVPITELAKLYHTPSKYAVTHYDDIKDFGYVGIKINCYVENSDSRYSEYSIYSDELILHNEYRVIQKLLSWHFDVFGLIPAGLAIDINTLESEVTS